MTTRVQRGLSWALFALLLGCIAWAGQAELLRWHAGERLKTRSLQQDLALAEREAARLPVRQAALAALRRESPEAQVFWPGPSPAAALLDLQEFAARTAAEAGLAVLAIEATRPEAAAPGLLRITLRAGGTLHAVQSALLTLERQDPKIAVLRARLEAGRETAEDPLIDLRLDLVALHASAEKAQGASE